MAEFTVRLKDYSMLYVECEPGYAAELSEFFSFYVPGYKFMPAYKNKVWDGKIQKVFHQLNKVDQPLRPVMSEESWNRIEKVINGEEQLESMPVNYYQENGSKPTS